MRKFRQDFNAEYLGNTLNKDEICNQESFLKSSTKNVVTCLKFVLNCTFLKKQRSVKYLFFSSLKNY